MQTNPDRTACSSKAQELLHNLYREGISFLDNLACHFESVFFSKIRVSALRRKGRVYFDSDLYMAVPTEQV